MLSMQIHVIFLESSLIQQNMSIVLIAKALATTIFSIESWMNHSTIIFNFNNATNDAYELLDSSVEIKKCKVYEKTIFDNLDCDASNSKVHDSTFSSFNMKRLIVKYFFKNERNTEFYYCLSCSLDYINYVFSKPFQIKHKVLPSYFFGGSIGPSWHGNFEIMIPLNQMNQNSPVTDRYKYNFQYSAAFNLELGTHVESCNLHNGESFIVLQTAYKKNMHLTFDTSTLMAQTPLTLTCLIWQGQTLVVTTPPRTVLFSVVQQSQIDCSTWITPSAWVSKGKMASIHPEYQWEDFNTPSDQKQAIWFVDFQDLYVCDVTNIKFIDKISGLDIISQFQYSIDSDRQVLTYHQKAGDSYKGDVMVQYDYFNNGVQITNTTALDTTAFFVVCYSGYTASMTTPIANVISQVINFSQYPKIYVNALEMLSFTEQLCKIKSRKVFLSKNLLTVHPDITYENNNYKAKNHPIDTAQDFKFYVRVTLLGNTEVWLNNQKGDYEITLSFICPAGGYTIPTSQPSTTLKDPGSNVFFTMNKPTILPKNCPITQVTMSSIQTSIVTPTDIQTPVLQTDGTYVITPNDQNTPHTYSFYMRVSVQGGYEQYLGPWNLMITCNRAVPTFSFNSKLLSIDETGKVQFTLPTTSGYDTSICIYFDASLILVSSNPQKVMAGDMVYVDPSCSSPCTIGNVDLNGQTNIPQRNTQEITFVMQIKIDSNTFQSPSFVHNVCSFNSSHVEETFTDSRYGYVQNVSKGSSESEFRGYKLFELTPLCPMISVLIGSSPSFPTVDNLGLEIISTNLREPTFVPTDKNLDKTYTFYVKVKSKSNSWVFGPRTLRVGCPPDISIIQDPDFKPSKTFRFSENKIYQFKLPTSIGHCVISSTTIVNATKNNELDPSSAIFLSGCPQPCTQVEFPGSEIEDNVTFFINSAVVPGTEHLSSIVSVNFDCSDPNPLSTSLRKELYFNIEKYDNTKNKITLNTGFACSIPECCRNLKTGASKRQVKPFIEETQLKLTYLSYGNVEIEVPNQETKNFVFFIYQDNQLGASVVTLKMTVNVDLKVFINDKFGEILLQREALLQKKESQEREKNETLEQELEIKKTSESYFDLSLPAQSQFKNLINFQEKMELQDTLKESLACSIVNDDYYGTFELEFSSPISTRNLQLAEIDESVLNISISYKQEIDQEEATLEYRKLTWKATQITDTSLSLQMIFENPDDISISRTKDILRVEILDRSMFKTKDLKTDLSEHSLIHYSSVKKQLKDSILSRILKKVIGPIKITFNYQIVGQFVLNFFIAVSLKYILSNVSALEMMVYQMMIQINQPANSQIMTEVMAGIFNIEMIDPSWSTELIFDFFADQEYVRAKIMNGEQLLLSINLVDMGFDSFNPILNSGGLFLLSLALISLMVVSFSIALAVKLAFFIQVKMGGEGFQLEGGKKKKSKSRLAKFGVSVRKLVQNLFFNPLLLMIKESLIIFFVSWMLFFSMPKDLEDFYKKNNPYTYTNSYAFACLCIFMSLFVLPFAEIYLFTKSEDDLYNSRVQRRIGFVYAITDVKTWKTKTFGIVFWLRRILVVVLCLFCPQGLQLIILMIMNMISLAYFGLVRPLNSMGLNRMELLNEFIILILSDLMVFFTDYCYDSQIKQIAGWINIFIISTYCICLVYAMTYDSIRKVYLKKQVKINQTYKSIITKLSKKLDFLKKKEKKEVKLPTLTQYTATENINDLSFGSAAVDIIRTPNAGGEMPKFIIPLLQPIIQDVNILIQDQNPEKQFDPEEFEAFWSLHGKAISAWEDNYQDAMTISFKIDRDFLKLKLKRLLLQNWNNMDSVVQHIDVSKLCSYEKAKVYYEIQATIFFEKCFRSTDAETSLQAIQEFRDFFKNSFYNNEFLQKRKENYLPEFKYHELQKWSFIGERIQVHDNQARIVIGEIEETVLNKINSLMPHQFFEIDVNPSLVIKESTTSLKITQEQHSQYITYAYSDQDNRRVKVFWNLKGVKKLGRLLPEARQEKLFNQYKKHKENPQLVEQKIDQLYRILIARAKSMHPQRSKALELYAEREPQTLMQVVLKTVEEINCPEFRVYLRTLE